MNAPYDGDRGQAADGSGHPRARRRTPARRRRSRPRTCTSRTPTTRIPTGPRTSPPRIRSPRRSTTAPRTPAAPGHVPAAAAAVLPALPVALCPRSPGVGPDARPGAGGPDAVPAVRRRPSDHPVRGRGRPGRPGRRPASRAGRLRAPVPRPAAGRRPPLVRRPGRRTRTRTRTGAVRRGGGAGPVRRATTTAAGPVRRAPGARSVRERSDTRSVRRLRPVRRLRCDARAARGARTRPVRGGSHTRGGRGSLQEPEPEPAASQAAPKKGGRAGVC